MTPNGAHGEQFYAILRAGGKEKKKGYTVLSSAYGANGDRQVVKRRLKKTSRPPLRSDTHPSKGQGQG